MTNIHGMDNITAGGGGCRAGEGTERPLQVTDH